VLVVAVGESRIGDQDLQDVTVNFYGNSNTRLAKLTVPWDSLTKYAKNQISTAEFGKTVVLDIYE